MNIKKLIVLAVICIVQPAIVLAQFTTKEEAEKQKQEKTGSMLVDKLVDQTSRSEDIKMFTNTMTMLSAAVKNGATEEAIVWRDKIVQIAAVEIARSKRNLAELEAGNTDHLEEWWAENKSNSKLIVNVEINTLKNTIDHEEYLYSNFESWNLSKMKDGRSSSTIRGNLNAFKRDMERNLRFESDMVVSPPPLPPQGEKVSTVKGNAQGGMVVVNKVSTGNPAVENYMQSRQIRKEDFQENQALFKKSLSEGDDKAAKKAYKALLNVMQDEVNANSWMVGMIESGNLKNTGIDVNKLSETLEKQRPLAIKAAELKQSASSDFSSVKNQISGLVNNFALTL